MEERVLKLLPFAGGLLIFLGVLKVSIYYQCFNIPILTYLSLSEVLMLFLEDINTILVVVLMGIMHVFISDELYEKIGGVNFDAIILKYKKHYLLFFGVVAVTLILLLFLEIVSLRIWYIYIMIFFILQFATFLFIKKSINGNGDIEAIIRPKKISIFINLILIVSIVPLIAIKDVKSIQSSDDKIVLYFNDGKEISNSKFVYYLGKAGEYHFFYNNLKRQSIIIKNSDINKVEVTIPNEAID